MKTSPLKTIEAAGPASDEDRLHALAQMAELLAGVRAEPSRSPLERLEHALAAARASRDEAALEQRRSDQALDKVESTLRALRAASRVTESVASAFQREKVLAAIPDALIRTFGAATARVWLMGPGDRCATCAQASRCADRTQCLHLVDYGARGPLDLALARVPIGHYSVGRLVQLGKPISTNELASEPGLADPDWAQVERIVSFAGRPLVHEGELLGAVAMWSRAPIRDEMLEALRILAHHAATAIAGSQLLETVRAEGRRTQEAVTRLSALLDSERSGVVLLDESGRAAYVNGAFRRLFALGNLPLVGLGREQIEALLAPKLERLPGEPVRKFLVPPSEKFANGPSSQGEIALKLSGDAGRRIFQRYTASVRSHSGTAHGWMAVFDDVTAAREVERLKSEFISSVSHELRTPLASIKGSLALVLDGTARLDEETAQLLRVSERNTDRLAKLVSDILDISNLEGDRLALTLAPCSPMMLCAQAAEESSTLARPLGISLKVAVEAGLPLIRADPARALQILGNLLSNAFKFSVNGGAVTLRAELDKGSVRFEVHDQGPGIPAGFRDRLFTRFAQSDRTAKEQAGAGLGLAICQALVRKQGGEIGCDSVAGEGATFFFTLPLA